MLNCCLDLSSRWRETQRTLFYHQPLNVVWLGLDIDSRELFGERADTLIPLFSNIATLRLAGVGLGHSRHCHGDNRQCRCAAKLDLYEYRRRQDRYETAIFVVKKWWSFFGEVKP